MRDRYIQRILGEEMNNEYEGMKSPGQETDDAPMRSTIRRGGMIDGPGDLHKRLVVDKQESLVGMRLETVGHQINEIRDLVNYLEQALEHVLSPVDTVPTEGNPNRIDRDEYPPRSPLVENLDDFIHRTSVIATRIQQIHGRLEV